MMDVIRMWLMCRIFNRNERSWNKDIPKERLLGLRINEGGIWREFSYKEKGDFLIRELSKAINYGVKKDGLIGSYLYRYSLQSRLLGQELDLDGMSSRDQERLSNAQAALNNCIDDGFMKQSQAGSIVYLTSKGRKFAKWYHPLKVFFNLYPVQKSIEWGIPIGLVYLASRFLNISIQSK